MSNSTFLKLRQPNNPERCGELDQGQPAGHVDYSGLKNEPGIRELYFQFDGHALKCGYFIDDAEKTMLFEGKMLVNSLVGPRIFEFVDHTTGNTSTHEVGHTTTQTYSDEFFSASSWFKFDGVNV